MLQEEKIEVKHLTPQLMMDLCDDQQSCGVG